MVPSNGTALGADRRSGGDPVFGLSRAAWVRIAVVTALVATLFWPSLRRLWQKTNPINGEPNWGHSFLVPVVGLYYLYVHRAALLAATVQPLLAGRFTRGRWVSAGVTLAIGALAYAVGPLVVGNFGAFAKSGGMALMLLGLLVAALDWGLATLLFGILAYAFGIWPGQNDYVKDLGLVITLFGIVLTLCGWQVMRIAWFPIAFLVCAIPWPGLVYSMVAMPLQELAARVAVKVLNLTGTMAFVSGTKIIIDPLGSNRTLNVAEACAGMKSLMTFISLSAAMAFLSARPLWQKLIVTASAIPIAIGCNVARVAGQGLLDRVNHEWSEGFAHQFAGLVMLIPAFFLVLLVGWILDNLFIDEADEKDRRSGRVAPVAAAAPAPAPVRQPSPSSQVIRRAPSASLTRAAPAPRKPAAAPQTTRATAPRSQSSPSRPLKPQPPEGRA
ncbi:MAG TPA: exosortase/archaeosortase family protein [Tepidisphaeraceae bacterium]|nr:exosortase/archaeosortase family protein [Tepidisphaeraceae bacterium]